MQRQDEQVNQQVNQQTVNKQMLALTSRGDDNATKIYMSNHFYEYQAALRRQRRPIVCLQPGESMMMANLNYSADHEQARCRKTCSQTSQR
jgi:hypothetical protein